jgi:hypothetical protein
MGNFCFCCQNDSGADDEGAPLDAFVLIRANFDEFEDYSRRRRGLFPAAPIWGISPAFDNLCAQLQRKDPAVTVVDSDTHAAMLFTNEHARRLGEALQGNPHVVSLRVSLARLAYDYSDSVAPLFGFLCQSKALRVVNLHGCSFGDDYLVLLRFFSNIAVNPAIEELNLYNIRIHREVFDTLMQSTARLRSLQMKECYFGSDYRYIGPSIMRSLRQNGSLYKFAIFPSWWFREIELYQMRLYCQRNQSIPVMVANPLLGHGDDQDSSGKTDPSLFPKLFAAAKQSRRTAPTSLLVGLLALGDLLHPVVPANSTT